ncbi:thioredoxin domain-containing protein [Paenibacillus puerhi]|uniref:hypothetical protein n=1 Tax=Paenibacillus puerhi TaxID=2692622 RepID=UPI00135B1FBE|nr:hypothetical protein [Paenibacillus puerhi]
MGKTIEIFIDSSLNEDDMVERVKEYACSRCSILVHDANDTGSKADMDLKRSEYGITSLPAIVINGKRVPSEKLVRGKFSSWFHGLVKK